MSEKFDPYHKWLGIPKPEQPPHHYRLLGVALYESDPDVIEGAADRQMAHVQTHKSGPHSAVSQQLLNELSAAKLCLLNPKKKAAYDTQLKAKLKPAAAALPVAAVAKPVLPEEENVLAVNLVTDPAGSFVGGSSVSTIGRGRTAAAALRKKKQQQTAMMTAGLAVALAAAVGLAGWKLMAGSPEELPLDDGSNSPAQVAQQVPDKPTEKPAKKTPAEKKPDKNVQPGKNKPPIEKNDPPTNKGKNEPPDLKQPVNLLERVNLAQDITSGSWELARGVLSSSDSDKNAVVQFAVEPPSDYSLTLEVEPSEKYESLFVGVPVAGRTVMAIIDGWNRTASGLHLVDKKEAKDNVTTNRGGPRLKAGETNLVVAEVRQRGLVRVSVNDQQVFEWQGKPEQLSHYEMWAPVEHPGRPFIGGHYGYKFSRVELALLPREEPVKIAKSNPPKKPKDEPNEKNKGDLSSVGMGPKNKQPVPDGDELGKLRKEIRDEYQKDFADARTAEEKGDLADKLFHWGLDPADPLPRRYALMEEGRQMAAEVGRIELVLNCIAELRKPFDVDVLALQCDSLTKAAKATGVDHALLAATCLDLVDGAVDDERYEQAEILSGLAKAEAIKAKDADLRESAAEKEAFVRRLMSEKDAVAEARATLEKDAYDLQANLTLGKHLCLLRGAWEEGLPLLAKGADETLQELAELEQAEPDDSEAQDKLGDAWWEAAAKAPAAEREDYKDRARYWYEQALPSLAGARKNTVEGRLGIKSGSPASTALSPLDILLKKAATALKSKRVSPTSVVGTNRGAKAFDEINKDGGVLIGFQISLQTSNDDTYIRSLQPIYMTSEGRKTGSTYGRVNRNRQVTIEAKEGYVVTQVTLRPNRGNATNITGLGVTFAKLSPRGLGRKPDDLYQSDWIGDNNQANIVSLGVVGKAIMGIFGFERNNNDYPTGLGIYVLP
ncbi:MAG: hypothetical protein AB7O62_07655 [Pirellulales bacterium]